MSQGIYSNTLQQPSQPFAGGTLQPTLEVPVEHITSREWTHLTIGIWWRLAVCFVLLSVLGSVASIAIAFVVSRALGTGIARDGTLIMALTIIGSVGLSIVAAHWFLRWIITVQYGRMRLAVIRDGALEGSV